MEMRKSRQIPLFAAFFEAFGFAGGAFAFFAGAAFFAEEGAADGAAAFFEGGGGFGGDVVVGVGGV